jgi:5'-nucleotidase
VRIVLTNDDGVEAPGLRALAIACGELGHDLLIAAPSEDLSGAGAAIGRIRADQRIETRRVSIPGLERIPAHALTGPPGLAAMAACLGAFGEPPDAVLSGINAGPNTGHAVLHSGTVGAALTAASFGVSALALSLETTDPMHWQPACELVEPALAILCDAPAGTVLNVNAPAARNGPPELRWAKLDRFGSVRVAVSGGGDEWLQMEYRETGASLDPGSDTALLERGFATITAIEGIAEVPLDDLTRRGAERESLRTLLTRVPESEPPDEPRPAPPAG